MSLTRRRMFELVAAASGLMVAGRIREAWAQGGTRIERLAPELDAIIDTSQPIRELATGFGGTIGPAEGPVWLPKAAIFCSTTSRPAGG